jgi:hypothetical protein
VAVLAALHRWLRGGSLRRRLQAQQGVCVMKGRQQACRHCSMAWSLGCQPARGMIARPVAPLIAPMNLQLQQPREAHRRRPIINLAWGTLEDGTQAARACWLSARDGDPGACSLPTCVHAQAQPTCHLPLPLLPVPSRHTAPV